MPASCRRTDRSRRSARARNAYHKFEETVYSDPRRPKRDPKIYQEKTGFWYIRFYQRGKSRKRVPTGIKTRYTKNYEAHVPPAVYELAAEWARLWRDGKYDPWSDAVPGKMTTAEAVAEYLDQVDGSQETKKNYRTTLEPFAETLTPGLLIRSVQPHHVRSFVSQPRFAASTRASYFNRLRTFFTYCLDRHLIYEDPTQAIDRPAEPRTTRTVLLPDDVDRILIAAQANAETNPERQVCTDAYELAVTTGMRVGELVSRRWRDVDFERNLIRVGDVPEAGFTPKNEESYRNIPLFPRALSVLRRREIKRISDDPSEPVLLSARPHVGRMFMLADWLSRRFTEHREAAGVSSGTMHSCRHTFITYALALGIPESKLMAMTGHTKHSTILRYTHMVDELLQDAIGDAIARQLPGYQAQRTPELLRQITAFMVGENSEPVPETCPTCGHYLGTGQNRRKRKRPDFPRVDRKSSRKVPRTGFEPVLPA